MFADFYNKAYTKPKENGDIVTSNGFASECTKHKTNGTGKANGIANGESKKCT